MARLRTDTPNKVKHKNTKVGRFHVKCVSDQFWQITDDNGTVIDQAHWRYDAIRKAKGLESAAKHLDGMPKALRNKRLAFYQFNHVK